EEAVKEEYGSIAPAEIGATHDVVTPDVEPEIAPDVVPLAFRATQRQFDWVHRGSLGPGRHWNDTGRHARSPRSDYGPSARPSPRGRGSLGFMTWAWRATRILLIFQTEPAGLPRASPKR